MQKTILSAFMIAATLGLAACGGSSSSSSGDQAPGDGGTPGDGTASFTDIPTEFMADFTTGNASVCYDLETKAAVDCDTHATTWDLRFDEDFNIWLNGGIYGEGDAGAFGPDTLANMQALKNGAGVPGFFKDQVAGVFLENSWYAYGLNDQHKLWPSYRVYVVKSNAKQYKVRLTSFYAAQDSAIAEPGTSGVISFEYQEITEGTIGLSIPVSVDASAGGMGAPADDPKNKYSYFNFATGEVVALTDAEAEASADWDIAFKRTNVKLNSANHTAATTGALAAAQADFYAEDGSAIKDVFLAATAETERTEYEAVDSTVVAGLTFVADGNKSFLGTEWYDYNHTTHAVTANAENTWVIRTAESTGYAIFNVTEVVTSSYTADYYKVNFYPEVTE